MKKRVVELSFSSQVKNELSRIFPDKKNHKIAELSAIIRMSGSIRLIGLNKLAFQISTDNPAIARKIFRLLKDCFNINVDIEVRKNQHFKKSNTYHIYVDYQEGANQILKAVGVIEKNNDNNIIIKSDIPKKLIKDQGSKRAYIRGAFLGGGSISDPEKAYHLEFVTLDEELSSYIMELVNSYGFNAKIISRKNSFVVYLKESDNISDILNIMGAHTALLKLEDTKILKQMRNDVNRIVNCETANLTKTVNASSRQIDSIKFIQNMVGLDYLSENLKEIATVRLEYQDYSLKELGESLSKPLGKSSVNHRLKRLENIAEELRKGKISNDF